MKNARSEDVEDMRDVEDMGDFKGVNERQTLIASWDNGILSSVS
jgi:hypothetical protein